MSDDIYQIQTKYRQFGNILIVLGIIPIAGFALGFFMGLVELDIFDGFFLQIILDLILIINLLLLVINNKNIRDQTNVAEFQVYYTMIAFYIYITLTANLLYYIGFFTPMSNTVWQIILIAYDVIILIATIFELLAWIRLSKYAITVRSPFNTNIKLGSIILAVAAGVSMIPLLLDISSVFLNDSFPLEYLQRIYYILGGLGAIIYIVGYLKTGNNIKQMWTSRSTVEPTLGSYNPPMYGTPPPPTAQFSSIPATGNLVKFCIKCGSNLIPDGEFCPHCGWKVEKF